MKTHAKSLTGLLKRHFDGRKIAGAEVGVWKGDLSVDLLREIPGLTLWMIDPWEKLLEGTPTMPKDVEEVKAARVQATKATQFSRRTIVQDVSVTAAARMVLKKIRFDFVFIDANHMYEQVRQDIEVWHPLVLQYGILCGHDYNGRGDRKLGWGVKRAVDEAFGDRVNVLPGRVWWVVK